VQLFAVASWMDEGRGRGRVQKIFEDYMQNAKKQKEMMYIYFWWLCTTQKIIV
jgi:hypothetical protein